MSGANINSNNVRPHLGSGWGFPVRPEYGKLRYSKYEDDIEQAIGIILETSIGERIMRPHFGGGLQDFLFESNGSVTHQRIQERVRSALVDWEPRVDVERVTVTAATTEPNLMFIAIDYAVRRSNSFHNRVYPFYLSEAG